MLKIEDYLNNAEQCRAQAVGSRPEIKEQYLNMAKAWDMLAKNRQRTLDVKERVRAVVEGQG